jgi:hypothetical protein
VNIVINERSAVHIDVKASVCYTMLLLLIVIIKFSYLFIYLFIYLFTCLISSKKANYKLSMSRGTNKTKTYTQAPDKARQFVPFISCSSIDAVMLTVIYGE